MGIFKILDKPIFSSRFKFPLHIAQVVLVVAAVGLSVPRLFMNNVPRTRTSTIALGMGAKSLILLAYLILSEHVARFQRWHSYKAHAIISCLEILFWSGVAGLTFQANRKSCEGITCGLSWGVMVLAIIVINTEMVCAGICIREFREWKQAGKPKPSRPQRVRSSAFDDEEEAMQPRNQQWKESPVQAAERTYTPSELPSPQPSQSRPHHQGRQQRASRRSEDRAHGREERHMLEMQQQPPRYPGQQQYSPRASR